MTDPYTTAAADETSPQPEEPQFPSLTWFRNPTNFQAFAETAGLRFTMAQQAEFMLMLKKRINEPEKAFSDTLDKITRQMQNSKVPKRILTQFRAQYLQNRGDIITRSLEISEKHLEKLRARKPQPRKSPNFTESDRES